MAEVTMADTSSYNGANDGKYHPRTLVMRGRDLTTRVLVAVPELLRNAAATPNRPSFAPDYFSSVLRQAEHEEERRGVDVEQARKPVSDPWGLMYYISANVAAAKPQPQLPSQVDSTSASAANPIFDAPAIHMGQTTFAIQNDAAQPTRLGFDNTKDEPDRISLHHDLVDLQNQVRTIAITNIATSYTNEQVKQICQQLGRHQVDYVRMATSDGKWANIAFLTLADSDGLRIAREVLNQVRVVRNKFKADAAHADETNEDATKPNGTSEQYDQMKVVVDPITEQYIDLWKNKSGSAYESILIPQVNHCLALIKPITDAISHYNLQPPAQTDEAKPNGENGESGQQLGADAAAHSGDLDMQDGDEPQMTAEAKAKVELEIRRFRHRSTLKDRDRQRKEDATRKAREDAIAATADGLPTGPRAERAAPEPKRPEGADEHWYYWKGTWIDGYLYTVTDEERAQNVDRKECIMRRRAEREQERKPEFDKLLAQYNRRRARRIEAMKREAAREAQTAEERKARCKWAREWELNFDEERYAREGLHLYYSNHAEWQKRSRAKRAEREAWDAMDREAEAEEKAAAERARLRAEGLADAFLNNQAEEMAAQQPASRFKVSLAAAAQRKQRISRNNAIAEDLLEDDEEQQAGSKQRRALVPLAPDDTDNALAGLSPEEVRERQNKLAVEIREATDEKRLYEWPVAWNVVNDEFIDTRLHDWLEGKCRKTVGVADPDLVNAIQDQLRAHAEPAAFLDLLNDLLLDEAEPFVVDLWRMLLFLTESIERGLEEAS